MTPKKPLFVIQEHHARSLHYDFRLEHNGVLKSWAIPKNIPLKKGIKRLAVMTEDHPIKYAQFEGTIPEGEYGAGEVTIWDHGTYENKTHTKQDAPIDMDTAIKQGEIKVILQGKKASGTYMLIHTKNNNWIIFKYA
jgi:bifunctional non-homologous end joining protein LigD